MMNSKNQRLYIVSNRLPVQITGEGENTGIQPSSGGLVTAINSYLNGSPVHFSEVFWVGVPGCSPATWKQNASRLSSSGFSYLPVLLYKEQYDKYYNGFSNSVLWPLFHYFPSFAEYQQDYFDQFINANEHFHDVMVRQLRPGDTIWIHDYHLLPLARMLRNSIPELNIGFFLHIPFPSYELFRMMPRKWQEELLHGMLGADLIGFHTIDYAAHFLQSIQLILGLDNDRHILQYGNRLVKVDVFPISIDYNSFHSAYDNCMVASLRESLLCKMKGQKIIFSVDRLDYTKGLRHRLAAYQLFLQQNPEYLNRVVFILVIVPSRDSIPKYAERKKMIDEMISQVNSQTGNIHWQPVIYRYNTLSFEEMLSLYTACNLALITPLRDGMNLVAKEFVASRKDKRGVLVLSEMAGAARELTDALTINPNDISEMADKIREGLEMKPEEQEIRLENMQKRIAFYNVQTWADDFMGELKNIKDKQDSFQIRFIDEISKHQIYEGYRDAGKRLLLLDYDGTLVSFNSNPDLAVPGNDLIELIEDLCRTEGNEVFLISGRNSSWLQRHFGEIPVNLIAEHGARSKRKDGGWITEVETHSEWKEQVHQIMEMFVRRCAHSFIEEKDFSLVWHYRNSNPEQGKLRALELTKELNKYIGHRKLEVLPGNKIVEIRSSAIDKGTAIKKIICNKEYDFIFAVGDDRTDEDMFLQLAKRKNSYTIKVGPEASFAHYNLLTPQMVVALLKGMNYVMPAAFLTIQ